MSFGVSPVNYSDSDSDLSYFHVGKCVYYKGIYFNFTDPRMNKHNIDHYYTTLLFLKYTEEDQCVVKLLCHNHRVIGVLSLHR